jgi:hypothetical protein
MREGVPQRVLTPGAFAGGWRLSARIGQGHAMSKNVLVLYGSYREPRFGIRLAEYVTSRLAGRGMQPEIIDARDVGLPMLKRMY